MLYPLEKEIVGVKDLKEAHFFQGPHALQTEPVLKRYGRDMQGFKKAAKYLEGHPLDMADAAYRLHPFPRIPVYYLFWQGDAEFDPRISVLFDRSIEDVFSADAIWGLVSRVSTVKKGVRFRVSVVRVQKKLIGWDAISADSS
jgi:hypothetical protein